MWEAPQGVKHLPVKLGPWAPYLVRDQTGRTMELLLVACTPLASRRVALALRGY